jgi:hypothetical protein
VTLEQWAQLGEMIGGFAVVGSLIYVGIQIRTSNRVNRANARHQISEFVLQISMFRAQHADRFAEIQEKAELSQGDEEFRWWWHMMLTLHAETYYHQYVLGLMDEGHWAGYSRYIEGHSTSPGFPEFWADVGPAFSRDFCNWMTEIVNRNNRLSLPRHEDVGGESADPLKTR